MILLLDIGNSNIKIGAVVDDKIVKTWRIATDLSKTADEFGMVFIELLNSIGKNSKDIEGVIISSVAPSLNYTIEHMCEYYFNLKPIMVNYKINLGMNIIYSPKEDLGTDRIVNCVAGKQKYGYPCLIVDFGSATTFNVISNKGDFIGGVIAPGIKSSAEALTNITAKLPRIELNTPSKVIGINTVSNMQSGVIYGFRGLVEGIIALIKEECGYSNLKVIATGGMSEIIVRGGSTAFDKIDRMLSLEGLKHLYKLNT
ncbi:MAG TPA: type III pantothenate kinase [Clostridiales bacterium]|nr:type III pantothenate kinase [Clostridiales bacterium]